MINCKRSERSKLLHLAKAFARHLSLSSVVLELEGSLGLLLGIARVPMQRKPMQFGFEQHYTGFEVFESIGDMRQAPTSCLYIRDAN